MVEAILETVSTDTKLRSIKIVGFFFFSEIFQFSEILLAL